MKVKEGFEDVVFGFGSYVVVEFMNLVCGLFCF